MWAEKNVGSSFVTCRIYLDIRYFVGAANLFNEKCFRSPRKPLIFSSPSHLSIQMGIPKRQFINFTFLPPLLFALQTIPLARSLPFSFPSEFREEAIWQMELARTSRSSSSWPACTVENIIPKKSNMQFQISRIYCDVSREHVPDSSIANIFRGNFLKIKSTEWHTNCNSLNTWIKYANYADSQ